MSRLIDADALIERVTGNGLKPITEQIFRKLIDDAPTIDAVSVVRCKECRHNPWNYDVEKPLEYTCIWDDDFADREQTPDDYCSYGEREGE